MLCFSYLLFVSDAIFVLFKMFVCIWDLIFFCNLRIILFVILVLGCRYKFQGGLSIYALTIIVVRNLRCGALAYISHISIRLFSVADIRFE